MGAGVPQSQKPMKVLVTGGAGFIGAPLCLALQRAGYDVVAFDNYSRGKRRELDQFVPTIKGDIRDPLQVVRAAHGCQAIIHMAYVQGTQTFYESPQYVADVALRGMTSLMTALEMQPGRDLLLVSTSETYQEAPSYPAAEDVPLVIPDITNPRYSYGGGKIAQEVAAMAYSELTRRTMIVRPHNIYGPEMGEEHVIPQLARKIERLQPGADLEIQGTGRETRSFCFITDCVRGLELLLAKGEDRQVYHLGTEDEVEIGELAEMMLSEYEREAQVAPSELPKGSPARRRPDIGKMRTLGFDPQTELRYGLKAALAWYKANPRV